MNMHEHIIYKYISIQYDVNGCSVASNAKLCLWPLSDPDLCSIQMFCLSNFNRCHFFEPCPGSKETLAIELLCGWHCRSLVLRAVVHKYLFSWVDAFLGLHKSCPGSRIVSKHRWGLLVVISIYCMPVFSEVSTVNQGANLPIHKTEQGYTTEDSMRSWFFSLKWNISWVARTRRKCL